jgi:hypothetical protein
VSLHERFNVANARSPVQVPGMDRLDLAQLFGELGLIEGAEIGVMTGEYSVQLAQRIPNLHLRCVDSWGWSRKGPRGWWNTYWASGHAGRPSAVHAVHEERARKRLAPYPGIEIIKMLSHEAAALMPDGSLDFVYIDAEHTYAACLADLQLWSPKVRRGGIVSGDDYRYRSTSGRTMQFAGVDQAVDEFVAAAVVECFYTSDTSRVIEGIAHGPGRFSSFFWEQP